MSAEQGFTVTKPKQRHPLRQWLGKNYYCSKRRLQWWLGPQRFAKRRTAPPACTHSYIQHRSFLLRPLKGVDMYLQHNKVQNLRLAIACIDGVVIRPGETFSIWKLVGRTGKSKGYLEGLVLHNGETGKGIGGGLCQLGNLLYWMALHSPLTVTERWRHSYDVFPDLNRSIPFGCGATLSYNYIDLQLRNDTDYSFCLHLWLDAEYLHGELLGERANAYEYRVLETDHLMKLQWWGGYTRHNKIWQEKTHIANGAISRELVAENHALMMYKPLLPQQAESRT